jgi:hypothetical protein
MHLLREMLEKREVNYSQKPVYLISFYREGIEHKKKNVDLTEAVLKIYKPGYLDDSQSDQVKLLKMRRIVDYQESDSLLTKMKSGVNSVLMLDVMKHLPDFLELGNNPPYQYSHTDITLINDKPVNVISFEQYPFINEPLYKGELYIDSENQALLQAKFEIHPDYAKKAAYMYIEKKNNKIDITPRRIAYLVSYKPINGIYYVNHVRGDLYFNVKVKGGLFGSRSQLHIWFEAVSCEVDSINIVRFPRSDRLPTHKIFSDTKYEYDEQFWGNFNTIMPEEALKELIARYFAKEKKTKGTP